MVNLKEWDEQREEQIELVGKVFQNFMRRKKIKAGDVLLDDFRKRLEKGHVCWWPPSSIGLDKTKPTRYLASLFMPNPMPKTVLVPLNNLPDKTTFMYDYGLSEELGVSYELFLDLVTTGRIILHRTSPGSKYKADFYQEIFKACKSAGYLPCQLSHALGHLSVLIKMALIAEKMQIQREEGFMDFMLKSHPQYDIEKIRENFENILDKDTLQVIGGDTHYTPGQIIDRASLCVHNLRVLGFERLTKKVLEFVPKSKVHTWYLLDAYTRYLVSPFTHGLFGQQCYDTRHVEEMTFLRIIPDGLSDVWKTIISASPTSFRLNYDPFETNIMLKPDANEILRFIKKYEDKESDKIASSFARSAHLYDFDEAMRNYKKLSEIIQERISKEHEAWFKRSKYVKATLYMGIGLTASAGAMAGFQKLHWLLKEVPYIFPTLPYVLKELLKSTKLTVERTTGWLIDHWPFVEKGFPYLLYKYDIKPEPRQKKSERQ